MPTWVPIILGTNTCILCQPLTHNADLGPYDIMQFNPLPRIMGWSCVCGYCCIVTGMWSYNIYD